MFRAEPVAAARCTLSGVGICGDGFIALLDVAVRWSVRTFPGLSTFMPFPNRLPRKGIDSRPAQGRILFPGVEEVLHGSVCELLRNEQFLRPSFKCLAPKVDFNRGNPTPGASQKKVAPRVFVLAALNDHSIAHVPLDMHSRKRLIHARDGGRDPNWTVL